MFSSSPTLDSTHKQKLQKSFKLLKSHACLIANFTLQWQDLEDHLRHIHTQIESRLKPLLQQSAETIETQPQKNQNPENTKNPELNSSQKKTPENQTDEITVSVENGKELISYVKERLQDEQMLRGNLVDLFKAVDEPGRLILEALKEFYPWDVNIGNVSSDSIVLRRSYVILLEEFEKLREKVEPQASEEAKRVAVEWKGKLKVGVGNALEIKGFLQLLVCFGLVDEFSYDEIVKLFKCVLTLRDATELFRALGYADKASEFIQDLIKESNRLEAIRFIFAFELVDKFPPVPLLIAHRRDSKREAKAVRHKGHNSLKAQDKAAEMELAAVRKVIKCIETYNLGFEYSPKTLKKRVKQLRKHIREKNTEVKSSVSNPQSQQQNKKKRSRAAIRKAQKNQQNRNKRQKTASPNNSAHTSPIPHSEQTSPHQKGDFYSGKQDDRYKNLTLGTVAPSEVAPHVYVGSAFQADRYSNLIPRAIPPPKASPYGYVGPALQGGQGERYETWSTEMSPPIRAAASHTYVGASSNAYLMQPSVIQPASSGQGDQYLNPSGVTNASAITPAYNYLDVLYNAVRGLQSASCQPSSLLAGGAPTSSYSAQPFGLANSISSSRALTSSSYGLNLSAYGSSDYGSTRIPTSVTTISSDTNANAAAPYYHGDLLNTSAYSGRFPSSRVPNARPTMSGYQHRVVSSSDNQSLSSQFYL